VFRYLDRGKQAWVFEDGEGKRVLKLFDKSYFSSPWRAWIGRGDKNRERLRYFESGYPLAYRLFRDQCALIDCGWGSEEEGAPVYVIDRAGRPHKVDLSRTCFVLQKKGVSLSRVSGDCREWKRQAEQLVAARIAQGVRDGDKSVLKNYGVVEGKVAILDPGRFILEPQLVSDPRMAREEWSRSAALLERWVAHQSAL
jgi:hypothetical protein